VIYLSRPDATRELDRIVEDYLGILRKIPGITKGGPRPLKGIAARKRRLSSRRDL